MIKVKICGITNSQDALWAANLGADYVGLNFYPQSPRKVSTKNAKEIAAQLPPFVAPVGVFVDEPVAAIAKVLKTVPLKVVQLHGSESPETCEAVRALGVKVIKVLRLQMALEPDDTKDFEGKVDFFMFDFYSPETAGGTGQSFPLEWLQAAGSLKTQWFLAGGLTPANIGDAIKAARPPAVDVCSGVEKSHTRKDYDAMKNFITAVRMAK